MDDAARTRDAEATFRTQDLAARVEALREERDALRAELEQTRAGLRRLQPWSFGRFGLGLLVWALVVAAVVALARFAQ